MLRSKSVPARLGRVGLAAVVAAAGTVTLFQGVSNAAPLTYTASPNTGPSANAAYVIQVTGTGFADAAGNSLVHATGVQFAATCALTKPATSGTVLAATRFNVVSATRISVTTPSLSLGSATSVAWKVCVYSSAGTFALLGSATYTIYAAPAITAALKPTSGPSLGGNLIAITGTGFTSKSTVKVNGVTATNVKVTGTTSITATAPAHAASTTAVHVVVTTEGGPNTTSLTYDNYTYVPSVALTPNFGPKNTVIDVKGSGFNALDFSASPPAAVYFVAGQYDPGDDGSGGKTLGPVATDSAGAAIVGGATCGNIQVLSDTELVCTAPDLAPGSYTLTVVNDNSVDANTTPATYVQSAVSSGSTFTIAPF